MMPQKNSVDYALNNKYVRFLDTCTIKWKTMWEIICTILQTKLNLGIMKILIFSKSVADLIAKWQLNRT
jgi:hypothetical protein